MLEVALCGAGRIGAVHAASLAGRRDARLRYVFDVEPQAAALLADAYGARALSRSEELFADPAVGAVIIATPTPTHVDLIMAAAAAGKAIFCEKPIDLDLLRVDQALGAVARAGVPLLVGFNRRFDPSFKALHETLHQGAIGRAELVTITSRDPAPPPRAYVQASGGLFCDMMIHDFDLARWLLRAEFSEVFAVGSALVDPSLSALGDVDTAVVILRTAAGVICQISNSRRASYGYDQRVEVHGERGMLQAGNWPATTLTRWQADGVRAAKPPHFFLERYAEAYRAEMDHFVTKVLAKKAMAVDGEDGRRALALALAAQASWRSGQPVAL